MSGALSATRSPSAPADMRGVEGSACADRSCRASPGLGVRAVDDGHSQALSPLVDLWERFCDDPRPLPRLPRDGGRGASMRPEVVSRYQMATWSVSVIGTEESPLRKVSVTITYEGNCSPCRIGCREGWSMARCAGSGELMPGPVSWLGWARSGPPQGRAPRLAGGGAGARRVGQARLVPAD